MKSAAVTVILFWGLLAGCQSTTTATDGAATDSGPGNSDGAVADGAGGGGGDGPASQDGAGTKNSGDCDSDAMCAPGKCVELSPGGFRVCALPVQEATSCENGRPPDQCCKSSDCMMGKCYLSPVVPVCTGVAMLPHNVCAADMCQTSKDCSGMGQQVCVPAGALGRKVRACMSAGCLLDSDCKAKAGGKCAPVEDPCCSDVIGLYCVYPNGGCRTRADCPGGHCVVQGTTSQCVSGPPICPA